MASKRKRETNKSEPASKMKKTNTNKHWALGLIDTMNDPEQQVRSDDKIIAIKDKYPKAKFHYLILPKEDLSDLKKLKKEHVSLLKHMEKIGNEIISSKEHDGSTFKFGYHARASMHRLHLHVISDDMNSPCLKTKKHWISFTSEFFLNAEDVRNSLEKNGSVQLPTDSKIKEYFDGPLKCHKCDMILKTMPALKKHIIDCSS